MRKLALERDGNRCQICLAFGILRKAESVHHIQPLSQGGTHNLDNLISVCWSCHNIIEGMKHEDIRKIVERGKKHLG